jgi:hypothetical protein
MVVLGVGHVPDSDSDFLRRLAGESKSNINLDINRLTPEEDWFRMLNGME